MGCCNAKPVGNPTTTSLPHLLSKEDATVEKRPGKYAGSQQSQMMNPLEVARHYSFPQLAKPGEGQKVAIISMGGPVSHLTVLQDFEKMRLKMPHKLKFKDVESIPVSQNVSGDPGETEMDISVIGGICPYAEITVYRAAVSLDAYRGRYFDHMAQAVQQAVIDGNSVISISWGGDEQQGGETSNLEDVLRQAKEAGVTVCAASGDYGSGDEVYNLTHDDQDHVDYPASSPFVLACGGTEPLKSGAEEVWIGASGGGVSKVFPLPSWQEGLTVARINPISNATPEGRVVPDVAGLAVNWNVGGYSSAGTSAVAPMWAALLVLANQLRSDAGKVPVGFINEALYERAKQDQSSLFVDIVVGNNAPEENHPGFRATKGFDACTGWGVPKGKEICDFLKDLP